MFYNNLVNNDGLTLFKFIALIYYSNTGQYVNLTAVIRLFNNIINFIENSIEELNNKKESIST